MSPKIQAEIGIVLSYLLLLVGVIFWDWQAFTLLLSFIIDYVSRLLVYLYVSAALSKSMLEKVFATFSHLINGLALGLVQGLLIMFMAYVIGGEESFDENVTQLPWLIPSIALPMVIFQFMALRGKTLDLDLSGEKMGELLISAVTFPAIFLVGMVAYEWSDENRHTALITLVSFRILLEIWNNHFRKARPSGKKAKKNPGINRDL